MGATTATALTQRLNALGVPVVSRYVNKGKGNQERVVTRTQVWRLSRVLEMLRNPIYRGAFTMASRWGAVEQAVPALVDAATWQATQAQLTRNRALSRRPTDHPYLLRGLIRCAECARAYGGAKSIVDGKPYTYYVCGDRRIAQPVKAPRCGGKGLPAADVEAALWGDCREAILNPSPWLAAVQAQLRAQLAARAASADHAA